MSSLQGAKTDSEVWRARIGDTEALGAGSEDSYFIVAGAGVEVAIARGL